MNEAQVPVITLDGPSGTGKGTLCALLAARLNWHMLDSGALYRLLALSAMLKKISLQDVGMLCDEARSLNVRFVTNAEQESEIFLNDEMVTSDIRSETCGQNASIVAAYPEVRAALLERQRAFAKSPGLVTDGRDMGTVVFPNAILKIFLYASEEERARRRYSQLKGQKINVSLAQVVEELVKRDTRDTQRAHSPLMAAPDAVQIDTTGLSIEQVFENVLNLINSRLKN
jgi:cytidylate kinase